MKPKRIGITGNIGSGKSTVARSLVNKGAALIDADAIAREVTNEPSVVQEISRQLDHDLIVNGRLDRAKTATLVFNNPEARVILNSIIHPLVRQRSEEKIQALETAPSPPPVILQDIPLLFENSLEKDLDAVIVVSAPLELRRERVKARNNIRDEDFYARDNAQMLLEEKVKRADFVVDNSRGLEELEQQINQLWEVLINTA
ncbi:MAG: dephospho-CoA kinase [Trueperaceae bacterium]